MCGGSLDLPDNVSSGECPYCGTLTTFPKISGEQQENLYNRAEHFRRINEYDKAVAAYEKIIEAVPDDPEAYWGLVLSRFGIEYVEDPLTHERIPTCHRVQFESILNDADYLAALDHAGSAEKEIYENEAKRIADIQKNILRVSNQEKPFDVFICYKETTDGGSRTKDSALAQDIYYQLTNAGYKVFFSRITLESKLGQQYEPYIFAALNSAKVMLVIGSKKEYFEAVWVRNEWSRFLALMKKDRSKLLIPCYKDMDAYDIPDELSMFQAQDMGKIGFLQDIIHGIKKVIGKEQTAHSAGTVNSNAGTSGTGANHPLLRRAKLFLQNDDFDSAREYCEKTLDSEPENGWAYFYRLMAELQVNNEDELADCDDLESERSFRLAEQFADNELKNRLKRVRDLIREINEKEAEEQRKEEEEQRRQAMIAGRSKILRGEAAKRISLLKEYQDIETSLKNRREIICRIEEQIKAEQKFLPALLLLTDDLVRECKEKTLALFAELGDIQQLKAEKANAQIAHRFQKDECWKRIGMLKEHIRIEMALFKRTDILQMLQSCLDNEKKLFDQFPLTADICKYTAEATQHAILCAGSIEEKKKAYQQKLRKKRLTAFAVTIGIIALTILTIFIVQSCQEQNYNNGINVCELSDDGKTVTGTVDEYIVKCVVPKGVKTIKNGAFLDCKKLREVTFPAGLESIGESAFSGCSNLEKAVFPETLNTINNFAFSSTGLTEVTIPENVTQIAENAFENSAVQTINFPEKLAEIQSHAFARCNNLTELNFTGDIDVIGENAFYGCDNLVSIKFTGKIGKISSFAFSNCPKLAKISFSREVGEIAENAFSGCTSLKRVKLSSQTVAENNAFPDDCKILMDLTSSQEMGFGVCKLSSDGKTVIKAIAPNITKCVIPENVEKIAERAFADCNDLSSVTIPKSVRKIGEYAFANTALRGVQLHGGVSFEENSFPENCNVSWDLTSSQKAGYNVCILSDNGRTVTGVIAPSITKCLIPDGVTKINSKAFAQCKNLTSVTFPETLVKIPAGAFAQCRKLSSITFKGPIKEIGNEAFANTALREVQLPGGVNFEGNSFPLNCKISWDLTSAQQAGRDVCILSDDGKTVIGVIAPTITKCVIPDGVTEISEVAFANCKNLTSVTFPDSLTKIGWGAFYKCEKLTSVTLPDNVSFIGGRAFDRCSSLQKISFPARLNIPKNAIPENCRRDERYY